MLDDLFAGFGDSVDQKKPMFLKVKHGDFVVVALDESSNDFWIGQILARVGSSVDPSAYTLFQVANIDTGSISMINADCVKAII